MPRPRLASDEDIITATAAVLLRDGIAGVTLAEVARAVGLSRAALIARFNDREGLLAGLASRTRRALTAFEAAQPVTNKGPRQVLDFVRALMAQTALALVFADPAATAQLREVILARLDEPSRRRGGEVTDLLMAVLRGAVAEAVGPAATMHVGERLHLCLRLVYSGRPLGDEDELSATPAARAG